MRNARSKIIPSSRIGSLARKLKKQGKSIVTTNGVFDILHLGHITYLENARKMGDVLIVGINSDDSVRRIKGPKRPLNSQKARAACVAALECVDYTVIFDDDNPIRLLSAIKPSIHVKGGDYRGKVRAIVEREAVEKHGGKIALKNMVKGYSTTSLIERIVKAYAKK